jgi:hypothetical protein
MNSACASCCNRNGPCSLIGNLRRHWNIARYEPSTTPLGGEILIIKQTAETLGVATSTIHRRLNDGLRSRVAEQAPEGNLNMHQAMRISRQAVWQRVKHGEIKAIHVKQGRKKGPRHSLIRSQHDLFNQTS